ncbi:MAG: hypothetical protein ACXACU_13555 [Candidatus Hodarchaeales archaeon]
MSKFTNLVFCGLLLYLLGIFSALILAVISLEFFWGLFFLMIPFVILIFSFTKSLRWGRFDTNYAYMTRASFIDESIRHFYKSKSRKKGSRVLEKRTSSHLYKDH